MFNDKQIEVLNQELENSRIRTRSKANVNLSYLEGFDIIETANKIFGYGNWSYSISKLDKVSQELNHNQNEVICYKAEVQVVAHNTSHTNSIVRQDVGFGTGIAKTLAEAHEAGAKEAVTDAIKRAMRSFGNQFGNSLYDKSRNQQNQNYTQATNNTNPPQKQNHITYPNNQAPQLPQTTPSNSNFQILYDLGLQVVEQGNNLIVVGDGIFENKNAIKGYGFRWDGQNKTWYLPLRQVA